MRAWAHPPPTASTPTRPERRRGCRRRPRAPRAPSAPMTGRSRPMASAQERPPARLGKNPPTPQIRGAGSRFFTPRLGSAPRGPAAEVGVLVTTSACGWERSRRARREVGVLGDHERLRDGSAAVKHDRATTGAQPLAAVALERSSGPGAPAGRRMPVAAGDQVAVPRPAGDVAGMPLRRRQGDTGAAGTSPATLTIGTIEITVLPPQAQDPAHPGSPPPAPMPPAPMKSPDRLSRGLGPWFGRDQA